MDGVKKQRISPQLAVVRKVAEKPNAPDDSGYYVIRLRRTLTFTSVERIKVELFLVCRDEEETNPKIPEYDEGKLKCFTKGGLAEYGYVFGLQRRLAVLIAFRLTASLQGSHHRRQTKNLRSYVAKTRSFKTQRRTWREETLGEVSPIKTGKAEHSNSATPSSEDGNIWIEWGVRGFQLCVDDKADSRCRTKGCSGESSTIPPEAVFASYLIRVRVSAQVDSRYLSAFFQSADYWQQIEGGKRGIGQPNVNGTVLGEVQFPGPPLPEQRRIVAEIEKQFTRLDAGVAALQRVQANLKRYRAAVLKAACKGRLVPTEAELAKKGNRKSKFETGEALLARILTERRQNWQGRGQYKEPAPAHTTNLPLLPRKGVWARLEQLGLTFGGLTKNPKRAKLPNKLPYLRVANVYANELRLQEIEHVGSNPNSISSSFFSCSSLRVTAIRTKLDAWPFGRAQLTDAFTRTT